jgi:hypothetical protein
MSSSSSTILPIVIASQVYDRMKMFVSGVVG